MTEERGLTWSRKWHIIGGKRSNIYGSIDVGVCGAHVYRVDDPALPRHLKEIADGQRKDAGMCKTCAKQTMLAPTVTVELPELVPDDYHAGRWEVPLYNHYNDVIGEPASMYVGEVWIKHTGDIAVSSVPTPLATAGDARRLAAALLAAAEYVDKNPVQS